MIVELITSYIIIQWLCAIIISYSVTTESYAFSELKKMRKTSFYSVISASTLAVFNLFDYFLGSLLGFIIIPITTGMIIVSVLYSTLTLLFILNTTHIERFTNQKFIRIISFLLLPIGVFSLKVKKEYGN